MDFGSRRETAKDIIEDKDFREAYLWAYLKRSIPFQIRTMRTQREWSQITAGEILGKPQNVISRLESPAYAKLSLQTLLEIAKGFDVGLIVKFVPYSKLLRENDDVSFDALKAESPTPQFPSELEKIKEWSEEESDDGFWEEEPKSNVLTTDKFSPEPIEQVTSARYALPMLIDVSANTVNRAVRIRKNTSAVSNTASNIPDQSTSLSAAAG